MEKVRSMFMKELKEVNEKLAVSEASVEELRQIRGEFPLANFVILP